MIIEIITDEDEPPQEYRAEKWAVDDHNNVLLYSGLDEDVSYVIRDWKRFYVHSVDEGKTERADQESGWVSGYHSGWVSDYHTGTGDGAKTAMEQRISATKSWNSPEIKTLRDVWACLADRAASADTDYQPGLKSAADFVFSMIESYTGIEGLEYSLGEQHPTPNTEDVAKGDAADGTGRPLARLQR